MENAPQTLQDATQTAYGLVDSLGLVEFFARDIDLYDAKTSEDEPTHTVYILPYCVIGDGYTVDINFYWDTVANQMTLVDNYAQAHPLTTEGTREAVRVAIECPD